MIDMIHNLVRSREKEEHILIHRDNDLPKLLYNFKQSGDYSSIPLSLDSE